MLSIGVVARQTGLDISTLRKWESRYGFPQPQRRESGQRRYRTADVEALQEICRRIAAGERVGQIMRGLATLDAAVATRPSTTDRPTETPHIGAAVALIRHQNFSALKHLLGEYRQQSSMLEFIQAFVTPLSIAVGEAWASGELPIHAEHFYSALVDQLVQREIDAIGASAPSTAPRVLLVTLAGEKHTLGLAMIHAVLLEAGVPCMRLNSDLPVSEIVAACLQHGFRAVGLSASVHYSRRLLRSQIEVLRKDLPAAVELWLGGRGIDRVSILPTGCRTFNDFYSLIEASRSLISSTDPIALNV